MKERKLPTGVYPNGNRYSAVVRHKNKRHYLGSYPTPEKAAEKVRLFRKEHPLQKIEWRPGDNLNG